MEEDKNGYYKKYDTKSTARAINRFDEQFRNDVELKRDIEHYRELVFTQKLERNERRNVIIEQQNRVDFRRKSVDERRNSNAERRERINPQRIATTFEKLSNSYAKQAKQLRELKQKRNQNSGLSL